MGPARAERATFALHFQIEMHLLKAEVFDAKMVMFPKENFSRLKVSGEQSSASIFSFENALQFTSHFRRFKAIFVLDSIIL